MSSYGHPNAAAGFTTIDCTVGAPRSSGAMYTAGESQHALVILAPQHSLPTAVARLR